MSAIVTIMRASRHEPEAPTVVASYTFEDAGQAQKVADDFGDQYSIDGTTVFTAEVTFPRDGSHIGSLHMAYSIKFVPGRVQSGSFEQTEWLVSDEEVENSGGAIKAAFDDHESAYANDADGNIVKLESTYTGDLVFYSFNPFIYEKLDRELTLGY